MQFPTVFKAILCLAIYNINYETYVGLVFYKLETQKIHKSLIERKFNFGKFIIACNPKIGAFARAINNIEIM